MTDPANPAYVHWVVTNIGPSVTGVPSAPDGDIGIGTTGANWAAPGNYAGVCLADNTYVYTLYALDADIAGEAFTDLDDALEMADGHVLAVATLEVKGH